RKTLKQIGLGDISLRGMQSKNAVQSVDADAIVVDEYDECIPVRISEAEKRLSGAKAAGRDPRIRRLGRPSVPGYGIDKQYDRSDQRRWMVVCPGCEEEQPIDWAANMRWRTRAGGNEVMRPGHDEAADPDDVTKAWRACRSCDASLEPPKGEDFGPIHRGRWVAQSPGLGRPPGFWLQRLIVPRTDLEAMVVDSRATQPGEVESFFNADLGLAYATEDAYLTDIHLDRAANDEEAEEENLDEYGGWRIVIAGLDSASERALNLRVSEISHDGRRRAIWIGAPKNFEEVAELMVRLNISVLVGDSQPERRYMRGLAAQFPGRVFLCRYDEKPESDAIRYDTEKNLITVNRTEAIDAMMDSYRQGLVTAIHKEPPTWREQMKSMKRRIEADSKGRPVKRYVSTSSMGDDYAHAEVFDVVAAEMVTLLEMAGARVGEGEPEVLTEEQLGYRRSPLTGGMSDRYEPGFGEGGV
ncbi:MAG: phage terminase large subunit family protein, partial [Solirubrobacterales bacterium]